MATSITTHTGGTVSGTGRTSYRHARAFSGGDRLTVDLEAQVRFREDKQRASLVNSGVPSARVRQILSAVLDLSVFEPVEQHMLRIDVHRGDGGRYRHDFGLALAVAMVSSLVRKPLSPDLLFLGDVDLRGNVRDVPAHLIDRLNDAVAAYEIETPVTIILAPDSATWVNASSTVKVLPVANLAATVAAVWAGQALRAF